MYPSSIRHLLTRSGKFFQIRPGERRKVSFNSRVGVLRTHCVICVLSIQDRPSQATVSSASRALGQRQRSLKMATATDPSSEPGDPAHGPTADCEMAWAEVVEECRRILDDEEDYQLIVSFHSYEHMANHLKTLHQKQAATSAVSRMLFRVLPSFERFHSFSAYILLGLSGQNMSAACFLGASVLLLEVSRFSSAQHNTTPQRSTRAHSGATRPESVISSANLVWRTV